MNNTALWDPGKYAMRKLWAAVMSAHVGNRKLATNRWDEVQTGLLDVLNEKGEDYLDYVWEVVDNEIETVSSNLLGRLYEVINNPHKATKRLLSVVGFPTNWDAVQDTIATMVKVKAFRGVKI